MATSLNINELIKLWHFIASNDGKITESELISISYRITNDFKDAGESLSLISVDNINEGLPELLLDVNQKYTIEDKLDLLLSIYLFSLYDEHITGMTSRLELVFSTVGMENYYELIKKSFTTKDEISISDCGVDEDVKIHRHNSCHKHELFTTVDCVLIELNNHYWLIWKNGKNFFVDGQNVMGSNRLIRLNENQKYSFENLQSYTDIIHLEAFLQFLIEYDVRAFTISQKNAFNKQNNKQHKISFSDVTCGYEESKKKGKEEGKEKREDNKTKNINFQAQDGDLIAIIGPSGAGKSTIFKALMGTNQIFNGTITLEDDTDKREFNKQNYNELTRHSAQFGYVSQEEVFIKELTVLENIDYYYSLYAKANNLDEISKVELEVAIDNLLEQLKIKDKKLKQVYKNGKAQLSGGELKRLNIALELIKNPNVLLMDEPTSGLSSQDTVELIDILKTLSKDRVVFTIIHQPSFEIFIKYNKVIILNKDGYNIFSGDPKTALEVFNIVSDKQNCCELSSYAHIDPSVLLEANKENQSFWKTLGYVRSKLKAQQ